ncbi:MAG: LLM class flavin-dependent oxidoreductase, partial [Candidatus Limnocylindrales bacterium]
RIELGTLVTGVTYRHPGLLVKTVTSLDVLSGGRAWLGIGAAWNEELHRGLGVPYPPVGERFERLEETLQITHQMWDGDDSPYAGKRYTLERPLNVPQPVRRPRPPILVGGGGERVTLKLVARYADACNIGGGLETVRRKEAILREHCQAVGRDHREIERTTGIGTVFIRDDRAEAERLFRAAFERNRIARVWADQPVGTPEDVAERLAPYLELGYRHFIAGVPATYDAESMTRLISDVKPILERGG